MRKVEDKELRDYEIRQWFYLLQQEYHKEGMSMPEATEQAYDDIGIRFCLRKTSIRRAKNAGSKPFINNRSRFNFEMNSNLEKLEQAIQKIKNAINRQSKNNTRK